MKNATAKLVPPVPNDRDVQITITLGYDEAEKWYRTNRKPTTSLQSVTWLQAALAGVFGP